MCAFLDCIVHTVSKISIFSCTGNQRDVERAVVRQRSMCKRDRILTASGIREKIINAITSELKFAVAAGIGLFIALLRLQNAGIIGKNDAVLGG